MYYYNIVREHTTTRTIPMKTHGSLNSRKEREKIMKNTEKSRKRQIEEASFQEGNRVLVSNKVELKSQKSILLVVDKNKIHKKGGKTEKFKTIALIVQVRHQTCLIKIVELDEDLDFLMVGKKYIARNEHLVKIKE